MNIWNWLKRNHALMAGLFISIMYLVGLVQIIVFGNESIMELTPMQLLLSFFILYAYTYEKRSRKLLAFLILFLLGLAIEIIGVNTGFPFGEYAYGNLLGYKIWGTPLIIGINWILIVVGASQMVFRLMPHNPLWQHSLIVGLISVGMDVLIEPVAIHFGMWEWDEASIPMTNYLSWAIISALLSYLYGRLTEQISHTVVIIVILWVAVFFGLLNLYV
jgi:putative membrane protein